MANRPRRSRLGSQRRAFPIRANIWAHVGAGRIRTGARASPRPSTPGCRTPPASNSAGPLVVVWDNVKCHVSGVMAGLAAVRPWLTAALCARAEPGRDVVASV